jgi:hypothetical protein|tara:strand:+ start:1253 stop:1597 length:345 start_codon:yes stop_codon:yes gene_type:complete
MSPIFYIILTLNDPDEYEDEEEYEDYLNEFQNDVEEASYILSNNQYGDLTLNQKHILHYEIDKSYFTINRKYEIEHNISKYTDNTFRRNVVSFCEKLYQYFEVDDGIDIELYNT